MSFPLIILCYKHFAKRQMNEVLPRSIMLAYMHVLANFILSGCFIVWSGNIMSDGLSA